MFFCLDGISQIDHSAQSPLTSLNISSADLSLLNTPPEAFIKKYVEKEIKTWQEKGEFEKTLDWQKRVNNSTRTQRSRELQKEAEKEFEKQLIKDIDWAQFNISSYDADNETYLITSRDFGQFALMVPISEAKLFKESWAESKVKRGRTDFYILPEKSVLKSLSFYNSANRKSYTYFSEESLTYTKKDIQYDFDPIQVDMSGRTVEKGTTSISSSSERIGKSDVDIDIPNSATTQENTFVVIIANEVYYREQNVDYALNDGESFNNYCIKTLGIPKSNVHFSKNSTFGLMKSEINWISSVSKAYAGKAKLIFYYAGHGMPNESTKKPFLLPVDGISSDFETAISLESLYKDLTEHPAELVTVFLDACFSGSQRGEQMLANARSVRIVPVEKKPEDNLVVFSAATGDETAYPFHEQHHGLFSYYLLKKLKETQGKASYKELSDYVRSEVTKRSIVVNQKSQTPTISIGSRITSWESLTLLK